MARDDAGQKTGPGGAAVVRRLMQPRSVVIVGMSTRPGAPGHTILANFTKNNFKGDIHLVGRSGGEIDGRPVLKSMDEVPEGVDLAVLTVPAAAVREAVADCVRRKVGGAVIFAAGFAELNEEGRVEQEAITRIANEGGLALVGPNCLGYTNYVDQLPVGFFGGVPIRRMDPKGGPAVAIMGQSGGLVGHFRIALEARGLQTSYTVTTGNEAGLGLSDFVDYLAEDDATRVIMVYAEHVRAPEAFFDAARKARTNGKHVVMMHPGRGAKAQEATKSHTGALAGDYQVMRTQVEHAGIMFVESLEEMTDVSEVLARFPEAPSKGVGIVTFSGAFCSIAYDICEDLGLDVPPMSDGVGDALRARLPSFATVRNPLDLTTQPAFEPDLLGMGVETMLDDPNMGSVLISVSVGNKAIGYAPGLAKAMARANKPVVMAPLGENAPLPEDFVKALAEAGLPLWQSSERALRALSRLTQYGRHLAAGQPAQTAAPFTGLPELGSGTQPEWLGKEVFRQIGIKVPDGHLAASEDDAVAAAGRIGYPVVIKAQAAALAHKTEAGGVIVGIKDEGALRKAWQELNANVSRHAPGLKLDGVLVEAMAPKGLELVVGARRDPQWGPIILVGLGGIWVEALGDVRLLPAGLPKAEIAEALMQLKTAKLLKGFRGAPAVDVDAVAETAALIGRLMLSRPDITEIDVNPLVAHGKGQGVTALDALIVTR